MSSQTRQQNRGARLTPEFLKQLRSLRVAVLHPKDEDGETLTQQLRRIGCQVQTFWPPVPDLPDNVDLVFCAVDHDAMNMSFNWVRQEQPPAVIAIISYENPTIFEAMIKLGATGVLTAPIRSTGILSTLVLTVGLNEEMHKARKRVQRLEQKLLSVNQINDAKAILMRTRNVGDAEAYRIIREQAMSRRVPTEEIARAIIHANSILSGPSG